MFRKPRYPYDPECKVLAEHFLDEQRDHPQHEERVDSLASEIQHAIEVWCDEHAEADADREE